MTVYHGSYRKLCEQLAEKLSAYRDCMAMLPPCVSVPRLLALLSQTPDLRLLFVSASPLRLLSLAARTEREGLSAPVLLCGDSGEHISETLDTYAAMPHGSGVLFLEPEYLLFPEAARLFRQHAPTVLVLDEAHRASYLDPDFTVRYEYIVMAERRYSVRYPILALSEGMRAETLRASISEVLGFSLPFTVSVPASFSSSRVRILPSEEEQRWETVSRFCTQYRGKTVLLCAETAAEAEDARTLLAGAGIPAVCCTGEDDPQEAFETVRRFLSGEVPFAVCTDDTLSAFCERNVDVLFRLSLPRDPAVFAREVLHAVRNGSSADCYLLYVQNDIRKRTEEIHYALTAGEDAFPDTEAVSFLLEQRLFRMKKAAALCETDDCLIFPLASSVGGIPRIRCGVCSSCEPTSEQMDVTEDARTVLSCIRHRRFRERSLIRYLRGEETAKSERDGFFGCLRESSVPYLTALVRKLEKRGYVRVCTLGDRTFLETSYTADMVLSGERRVFLPQEAVGPFSLSEQQILSHNADDTVIPPLRDLRRRLAEENAVMPYEIFGEFTLHALGVLLPEDRAALASVPRLPKDTAERMGDEILTVIRNTRNKNPN